jgi:hypothetical protein
MSKHVFIASLPLEARTFNAGSGVATDEIVMIEMHKIFREVLHKTFISWLTTFQEDS